MKPETDDCLAPAVATSRRLVLLLLAVSAVVGVLVISTQLPPDGSAAGPPDPARAGLDDPVDVRQVQPNLGAVSASTSWRSLATADGSSVGNRHETSAVALNGMIYVLGGRGKLTARVFDTASLTWRGLPNLPLEMHHFQPVAVGTKIYAIAAMTCCFPEEPGVSTIHVFDTLTESWSTAGEMPSARVRGGAGAVVHAGSIYLVGGNTRGHSGGAVPWLDRYDPVSRRWEILADAPTARDHFQATLVAGRIVAAGGRQSAMPVPQRNTVRATDVYDIAAGRWSSGSLMPTGRGGTVSVAHDGETIVLGGEIATSGPALDTVESYDLASDSWKTLSPMLQGRHGSGAAVIGDTLHIFAGSMHRGGAPETDSHETLSLVDDDDAQSTDRDGDGLDDGAETALHGTDPDDPDSDDDGLTDGREIALGTDPLTRDSDADGLADGAEVDEHGTDPARLDTDEDGLSDGAEVDRHGSDPLRKDTDGDGIEDGDEVDVHGTDPSSVDSDVDGLSDDEEIDRHGTDPTRADSDGDGLDDKAEIDIHGTDPTREDTDGDGLPDGAEANEHRTDPLSADTDGDGTSDGDEVFLGSDPLRDDPEPIAPVSTEGGPTPPSIPPARPVIDDSTGSGTGGGRQGGDEGDNDAGDDAATTAPAVSTGGGATSAILLLLGLCGLGRRGSTGRGPSYDA